MKESSSWSTTTRYLVLILMLGLLLWFLFVARELIGPLIIATLIAFILNPLVDKISKKGKLGRNWVVLFVYLLFVAVFVLIGVLVVPKLPPLATRFAEQLDNIILVVEEVASRPIVIFGAQIPLESLLANWPQLTQIITQPGLVINMFAATSQNLVWILLVLVTTYYLLLDGQRLRDWLFSLVPDSQKSDVVRLYIEVRTAWRAGLWRIGRTF
jgi:predicted PurR-regulated permease PerM